MILTAVLAAVLALWPLGVSVAPVRATDPAAVSPAVRAAFQTERDLSSVVARQLMLGDKGKGVGRQVRTATLTLRLRLVTSVDQRAAWIAQELSDAGLGPGRDADLSTLCFHKPLVQLNEAEAVTLVALARLGPAQATRPENAARLAHIRDRVLHDMKALGLLREANPIQAKGRFIQPCGG